MKNYILMADIIDSGEKKSQRLVTSFKKLVDELNGIYAKELLSPLTITLGDEFQGVVGSLKSSVQIIIDMEELIIKNKFDFKLRYVLNYGKIETEINPNIAHGMLGEGLTEARNALADLKKVGDRFLIRSGKTKQDENLNRAFVIYQNFVDGWSPKEYHIVKEFLDGKDYKAAAYALGLDISTTWRREKSLKIRQYAISKRIIFSYIK